METGVELITKERKRQIDIEGWSSSHDGNHEDDELARAAACYAMPTWWRKNYMILTSGLWPWHMEWWKPSGADRIKELTKAGALIAAEIDRLQDKAETEKIVRESN